MTLTDKYEFKRFVGHIDRVAVVVSHLGPSRSASSVRSSTSSSSFPPSPTRNRTHTLPPPKPSIPPATSAPAAPTRTETVPPSSSTNTSVSRSVSQPVSQPAQTPAGGVWSDLASLQGPTRTSTLPLQYLSSASPPSAPVSATNLTSNATAGSTTLGTNFVVTPASYGPSLGPSVPPADALVPGVVATQPMQPPFALGTGAVNPFAQMAAQQHAQAQQSHASLASAFGSSLPQQPSFTRQIQQPAFSRSVTNPFFNPAVPPQPQAPFLSMTPSPVPFTSSPFQPPAQVPFQQQPIQTSFQPQPPQFGNGQPSGASVAGNPFTSWLTQQPNGYTSAHVGQGSVNGPWGSM
jgi:stromal membrane-associated protein